MKDVCHPQTRISAEFRQTSDVTAFFVVKPSVTRIMGNPVPSLMKKLAMLRYFCWSGGGHFSLLLSRLKHDQYNVKKDYIKYTKIFLIVLMQGF